MLENILAAPEIDGVLLGNDMGTQQDLLMAPEYYRTIFKPGDIALYNTIKRYGKDVWVHSCGKIDRIIGDFVEIGLGCLNPVQPECMNIAMLKQKYGSRLSFYGGISTQKTLPYGTPDDVCKEVRQVIDIMSQDGGYITAAAQEIQTDVSYENIRALLDTAKEYA
jgi:uroporphyrinogen decarboxylase